MTEFLRLELQKTVIPSRVEGSLSGSGAALPVTMGSLALHAGGGAEETLIRGIPSCLVAGRPEVGGLDGAAGGVAGRYAQAGRRRKRSYASSQAAWLPVGSKCVGSTERRMTSRISVRDETAPRAIACTIALPSAVASSGPARTGSPVASAASWQW